MPHRSDYPTFRSFRRAVAASLVLHSVGPPDPARRAVFGALVWAHRGPMLRAWRMGFSPDQAGAALAHETTLQDPDAFRFGEVVRH